MLYKDYKFFEKNIKEPIYLNSAKENYIFNLGSINIIKGDVSVNNINNNENFCYTIDFYYIPTFQELRADLIDKIVTKKIDNKNINQYIENTFCNDTYQNISINRVINDNNIQGVDTLDNKHMNIVKNNGIEKRFNIDIEMCICPNKICIDIVESDTYDTIAKKIDCLKIWNYPYLLKVILQPNY